MAKKFRVYLGVLNAYFTIGVNVIGLPDFHIHTWIISKSIKETELGKYGLKQG
jgi:hypothetical protein